MKLKIALAQINVQFAEPDANFAKVGSIVKKAAKREANVVVFPEMWNTGYALSQLAKLADQDGQRTQQQLSKLASNYRINIVGGSVAVKVGQHFYNTTYVVNDKGQVVAHYSKVHLFGLMHEDQFMTAGKQENYFQLADIPSASFICYDLRFPEWFRTVARHGVDLIYLPAEWPSSRIAQWQIMVQSRAIENQAFVVAVNRVGHDPDNQFNGHSLVVDPLGRIIAEAGSDENITYATIDLNKVQAVRGPIPVFKDRRPALYH